MLWGRLGLLVCLGFFGRGKDCRGIWLGGVRMGGEWGGRWGGGGSRVSRKY